LPRRLGDDPLVRARTSKEGAAPEVAKTSPASYNDVFFQRRGEAMVESAHSSSNEAPEISEISEIPEMREAGTAPTEVIPAQAEAPSQEVVQPAPLSITEAAVATLNANARAAAQQVPPATEPGEQVSEEKSGGFFQRLLGKFK